MGVNYNPRIVTDGLIFAYDMSNIKKSWKGMPITNVVTNWDLDTGWSKVYCADILWNDYPPPNGINAPVVSFIDADTNSFGYWYSYGNYAPQDPSTTYSISIYVRTIGSGFSIRAYTADNSEVGRQWTESISVTGDGEWHRIEFNPITTPSDTQSDSLSFNFVIPPSQRVWLCAPQMTATSFHVPFVGGTRSNTESILDMTGNNTLVASSLTYSSDNKFSFNGSSNLIIAPENSAFNTQTPSVSVWIKTNSTSQNGFWFEKGNVNTQYSLFQEGSAIRWRQRLDSGLTNLSATTANYISTSNWANVVGTYNSSTGARKIYINGILVSSDTLVGNIQTNTNGISIGAYGGYNGSRAYWYNGSIGIVSVYNAELNDQQVQQNFNALRGRYGI